MSTRIEQLLSDALGYEVDLRKLQKRPTKRKRLMKKLATLEQRQLDRITKGRTRGAGAGGYNRDLENIVHQIRLIRIEIDCLADD